jgi:hypothetical protein
LRYFTNCLSNLCDLNLARGVAKTINFGLSATPDLRLQQPTIGVTFDNYDGNDVQWPSDWDPDREDVQYIPPPGLVTPRSIFEPTYKDAVLHFNRISKASGFVATINKPLHTKKTIANAGNVEIRGVDLRCACGRKYKEAGHSERHKSSRMSNCKWHAQLIWKEDNTPDAVEPLKFGWKVVVKDPRHNHMPSGPLGLPHFRQRDEVVGLRIKNGLDQRDSAMKILQGLQSSGQDIRLHDVHNELAKIRREELGGKTRIQALISFLDTYSSDGSDSEESKYFYRYETDSQDRVWTLFFAHPESFDLIRANPDVVQIDCTYKVNKFDMPLCHFVGVTSRNTTFDISFAFMAGEEQEDYTEVIEMFKQFTDWLGIIIKCYVTDYEKALKNALRAFYPEVAQRRCLWHINKNVQTQAVKDWDVRQGVTDLEKEKIEQARLDFIKVWQDLVNCQTEDAFWTLWDAIKVEYAMYTELLKYLEEKQIPQYEEWCECFCKYLPDFGNRVTSRCEGAHHRVKLALTSWTRGHLWDVVKDIHKMLQTQRKEHDGALQTDQMRAAIDVQNPEFQRLQHRITHQGLRLLKTQLVLAKDVEYDDTQECLGAFTGKYSMPCKHTLHAQLAEATANKVPLLIAPSDVGQHWWFVPPRMTGVEVEDERIILDPAKVKGKGRPKGATVLTLPSSVPHQVSQAKRGRKKQTEHCDLSRFEHVELTQQTSPEASQALEISLDEEEEEVEELPRTSGRQRTRTDKGAEYFDNIGLGSSGVEEEDSDAYEELLNAPQVAGDPPIVRHKRACKTKLPPKPHPQEKAPVKMSTRAMLIHLMSEVADLRQAKKIHEDNYADFGDIDDYPMPIDKVDLVDSPPKAPKKAPKKTPKKTAKAPKVAKTTRITVGMKRKAATLLASKESVGKKGRKGRA